MSSDKNPEVVGCDASIMRNVWEIREREYEQKMQLEQDRIEKSALPSINQDWANRLLVRMGKRVERKPKPEESQLDNNNIWKSKNTKIPPAGTQIDNNNVWKGKQNQVPPASPRGVGSAPMGRPGNQGKGFSTSAPNVKDKKEQYKKVDRLQSLKFITQTQPCAMVWGKSWKYNKSLPSPSSESNTTNWGQCWMFATQQPYSEEGKPWPNEPNMMDPHNLDLWKKTDNRVVESKDLDLCLPSEEWQLSWRRNDKKNKKDESENGENVPKYGFFTSMVESQRQNEALCSSEWRESWKATKPAGQQDCFTVPNAVIINESIAKKHDSKREMSLKWDESWKLVNHYDCNKIKSTQVQKSCSPEWANAWRAATVVSNNHKNSDVTVKQEQSDSYTDWDQQKESHRQNILFESHGQKYRDQHLHFSNEFKTLSEWNMSWKVTKNNSKPCEEMEKILKELQSNMKNQKVEENPNRQYSTSEKADPCYEQLKHTVIYCPKREFTHSKLLLQKHEKNILSVSEWKESWKTLKHRMRMERRRMRPDPSRPFRESDMGGNGKPKASEWKDSWKFTCNSLRQEPERWQQGWTTTSQSRVDRVMDQNHFAPVEVPKNGPVAQRSYGESWRFSRNQEHSRSGQGKAGTSASQTYRRYDCSVSDWQSAWMVSETQFHYDRPSLTQWMEAWRSASHREHWAEQVPRYNCMDKLMEMQYKRVQRAKAKMSYYFDNLTFSKNYPDKEWSTSWKAGSVLNYPQSGHGSSGNNTTRTSQQHTTTNGHGSKWGMSFRLANPMPRVEQPWIESSPNPCYYAVMWSRGKNKQRNINTSFSTNFENVMLWAKSPQFLQGKQIKGKSKSNEPDDPRVIITKKTKSRKHMYSNLEEKQEEKKKWAGCHLLGKTQPRPKKGSASGKKIKLEEETKDTFFEDWGESWRFLDQPTGLKKPMIMIKSPLGWDESWKFLIPPYQPLNGPKAK